MSTLKDNVENTEQIAYKPYEEPFVKLLFKDLHIPSLISTLNVQIGDIEKERDKLQDRIDRLEEQSEALENAIYDLQTYMEHAE